MAKAPAFQFYPKDWLSSGKVGVMTPAHEGAYIRLLCYCWDSGDCSIPDDDDALAVLSRLGEGWLKGGSTVVRKCFIPHPSKQGFLSNQRLLLEHEKQVKWRLKSARGGKKGGKNRPKTLCKSDDSKGGLTTPEPPLQPKPNTAFALCSLQSPDTQEQCVCAGSGESEEKSRFDEFWSAYPDQQKRRAAEVAYAAAIAGGATHEAIMAGLARSKANSKWKRGVGVPHADKYLNERRWEDEPASKVDILSDRSKKETERMIAEKLAHQQRNAQ